MPAAAEVQACSAFAGHRLIALEVRDGYDEIIVEKQR